MKRVDNAIERKNFVAARKLLEVIQTLMEQGRAGDDGEPTQEDQKRLVDPFIVQRLALVTYKSELPSPQAALEEAAALLAPLDPDTSNDTETLGLWGAVHKRLWGLTRDKPHLDGAVRAAERGFYLRNDYYNGINLAFMLNVRASVATDPAEAIADFVQARRVREEVLAICQRWLQDNPAPSADADARYWVLATKGEAEVGLGRPEGPQTLADAYASARQSWMSDSTRKQVAELQAFLADSPLRHLTASE
jgi:hypothetical protein